MREIEEKTEEEIVIAILFDVTAAFDNLQWKNVIAELQKRSCPPDMLQLIRNYLSNRRVKIMDKYKQVEIGIHRGCPQGSILGPDMWNICLDNLLNKITDEGGEIVAYADDLIVLIGGNSRSQVETKGQRLTSIISGWCQEQQLQLSTTKTEMILLRDKGQKRTAHNQVNKDGTRKKHVKGSLTGSIIKTGKGGKRPPSIKIEGRGIRLVDEAKYLGVTFGTRMTIMPHIKAVTKRGKRLFINLSPLICAHWGIQNKCLSVLYKGVFLPIMLYAVGAWGDMLNKQTAARLEMAQRLPLLKMAKAYRTTSTQALQVLTGEIPLDLKAIEVLYKYRIRKKIPFEFNGITYDANSNGDEIEAEVKEKVLDLWEERWNESTKGWTTHQFFPTIRKRLETPHVEPDYHVTQMLTGHGNFRQRLAQFKLRGEGTCRCEQGEENAMHVIYDCVRHTEERQRLKDVVQENNGNWPLEPYELIKSSQIYKGFVQYVREVMAKKEEEDKADEE